MHPDLLYWLCFSRVDFTDSVPPRPFGGNLDDHTGIGATMYCPVSVAGRWATLHIAQGDGELDGTTIKTSISGDFRIFLIKKES